MKRLLLASLAGLVLAPAVHAANLFSDPGFDEGTGPWVADSGTNAFRESTDDFAGNVNSGSLALATSDGQNADLAARACVAGRCCGAGAPV